MTVLLKTRAAEEVPDKAPSAVAVQALLQHILESAPFRTSRQCQDLLRYIVEHSLGSDDALLRERIIGVEVFSRQPTYDTSVDPVVRVRAADVRKRLAQYYQSLESGNSSLHIELQPGSYKAHFRWDRHAGKVHPATSPASPDAHSLSAPSIDSRREAAQDVTPPYSLATSDAAPQDAIISVVSEVDRHPSRWRNALLLAMLVTVVTGLYGLIRTTFIQAIWMSPQERFLAPLTRTRQPVLLYLGSNAAYLLSTDYLAQYRAAHGIINDGPEFFVGLPPNGTVRTSDLIPMPDTFLTMGDLAAAVQLTTLMTDRKKAFVLRSGRDLSFGDLRNRPSVMIGGFNNPWTLEETRDLPFSFQGGTHIHDRDHPGREWSMSPQHKGSTTEDYALVSRLLQSKTGGPLITVAGIGEFGTQAAAEFLSNLDRMQELLQTAPRGWENKNMQAVLHIKVVEYAPVSTEVIATSYW